VYLTAKQDGSCSFSLAVLSLALGNSRFRSPV